MGRFEFAVAAIAALAAMGLAGVTLAESPDRDRGFRGPRGGPSHDRGPERFLEEHADELGLDAETRRAIEKVIEESRERAEAGREASKADHEKMRALLQQPMPDEKAVMELVESSNAGRLEQKKNRMEAMLEIRKLLTDEQRAQLVGIREARRGSHSRSGAMRACRRELPEVCPDSAPGRETLQCMSENWDELSEDCRGSFDGRGRRGFGRWPAEEAPEE